MSHKYKSTLAMSLGILFCVSGCHVTTSGSGSATVKSRSATKEKTPSSLKFEAKAETGKKETGKIETGRIETGKIDSSVKISGNTSVNVHGSVKLSASFHLKAATSHSAAVNARFSARKDARAAVEARSAAYRVKIKLDTSRAASFKAKGRAHASFKVGSEARYRGDFKKVNAKFKATLKLAEKAAAEAKFAADAAARARVSAQIHLDLAIKAESEAKAAGRKEEKAAEAVRVANEELKLARQREKEAAIQAEFTQDTLLAVQVEVTESARLAADNSEIDEKNTRSEAEIAQKKADEAEKEAEDTRITLDETRKETEIAKQEELEAQKEAAEAQQELDDAKKKADEAAALDEETGDISTDGEAPKNCETAFATGEKTFIQLGITKSRWGWQSGPLEAGTVERVLYAGAAGNDISKGVKVGSVKIEVGKNQVVVTFSLSEGHTLQETHLYVGAAEITEIAPGKFGHQHALRNVSTDSYEVSISPGEPIYIVAHAVVCGGGK